MEKLGLKKSKVIGFAFLTIFAILVVYSLLPLISNEVVDDSLKDSVNFKDTVDVYFKSANSDDWTHVGRTHNLLYDSGKNLTRDLLGAGATGAVLNISLCNASAGCGAPVAGASEAFNTITQCGIFNQQGSYTSLSPIGNWTVTKTFTYNSTCNGVSTTINASRIGNLTMTNFAGANFTTVTLSNTNDQITINWSFGVS
mgnify:FL=1